MAILDAMQKAVIRLISQKPGTFFGSDDTFQMEICDLVNEVAQDVTKQLDWQALIRFATITGDGSETEFDLPDDYDRQLLVSAVQDTTGPFWGYQRITDLNAFTNLANSGFLPAPGAWAIYGDQLHFTPAPSSGASATYPYITKNYAKSAADELKDAFDADTDTFRLPERLLTLGLVWRWRDNKKLDATGDMEAFTKALDEYATKDKGSRVIRQKVRSSFPGSHPAWPWELG